MGSTVVCTAPHPVDLDDGRSLPPGETAEDVDLTKGINGDLVDAGALTVIGGDKRRGAQKPNHESKED